MSWLDENIQKPCKKSFELALNHQQQLTKPPGSLGQLEELAVLLASLQRQTQPNINNIAISIFAADHGIAAENVSAFPQSVTAEMIRNFAHGGAAISVLAKQLEAQLHVYNVGTVTELETIAGVSSCRVSSGTHNFCQQAAMDNEQLQQAMNVGKLALERAADQRCKLFIGGEMGIANTSSATAIASVLLQQPVSQLIGPGTGINSTAQLHKQQVIERALKLHQFDQPMATTSPLDCLRVLGGFEIAALVACYIRAGQLGIPLLIDGFISSVAALVALKLKPELDPWMICAHQSAEPGHALVIKALNKTPLLQLNMRLGEASGAACAVPLLKLACSLHNQMATFDSANISHQL